MRTYSQRDSSTISDEPTNKKRRVSANDVDIHIIAGRFVQKQEAHDAVDQGQPQLPPPKSAQPLKKGSILSYFKVRSPSVETKSTCIQLSEPILPSSTPPSSPPSLGPPRKKTRRLTTKPSLEHDFEESQKHETPNDEDHADDGVSELSSRQSRLLKGDKPKRSNTERTRKLDNLDDEKRAGTKKAKVKPAIVQTTLSLSLTETQFTECTECNMLYNPYHANDAKMHKKRHTAILRSKKTTIGVDG